MSTRFFHESNFDGLIEKVRQKGRASSNQKMAEQFNRLFNPSEYRAYKAAKGAEQENKQEELPVTDEMINPDQANMSNPAEKESTEVTRPKAEIIETSDGAVEDETPQPLQTKTKCKSSLISGNNSLHKRLSDSDMVVNHHNTLDSKSKKSAPYIKDSKSCNDIKSSASNKTLKVAESDVACKGNSDLSALDESTGEDGTSMCAVLCSMMKAQLLKTYEEVVARYGGHFDMSHINAPAATDDATNDKVGYWTSG